MDQIASFGFNAIRLPFSSECIEGTAASVSGVDSRLNPELQGLSPVQIMDRVVAAAAVRNIRVVLDRHRPDSGAQSALWYTDRYPEQQWIADWVMLANRYADQPTVIGADLHNEPHGAACWGCGDPATDWAAAATRAGNAVLAANPHLLILVEGVEKQSSGTTWWGGGLADVAAHPITLDVPHELVYSPHDYPASIFAQTWFTDPAYPANLPALWDSNWGFIAQQGIAPVLLGEFGTKLATESDAEWLDTMVDYLAERQLSFAYWSYNPNSGDTGGLVADDWTTPQQAKLDALAPVLEPSAQPVPGGTGETSTPPPPAATPAPTSTSTAPSMTAPSTAVPSTTVAPTTAPSMTVPSTSAAPTTGSPGAAAASWQLQSSWPNGYVAQVIVSAPSAAVSTWSVSWPDRHATSVVNAWGMNCSRVAELVSCTGADWAAAVPAGGSVTVGLQVANDGTAPAVPVLAVN